jgi:hypothetical protein
MAEFDHSVLALDVDTHKVVSAGNGRAPPYEPRLEPCSESIWPLAVCGSRPATGRPRASANCTCDRAGALLREVYARLLSPGIPGFGHGPGNG